MPKILLIYYSRSGNTQEMAHHIAEAMRSVPGVEVTVQRCQEADVEEWLEYDALLLGSPVYYGGPAAEIKQLVDASVKFHGKLKGKLGGAFASSANIGGGNETTLLDILHAWLIHGMLVVGDSDGDHYGPVSIEWPDERAKRVCEEYGKLFAQTAVRLFG